MTSQQTGPFETEAEARHAAHAIVPPEPGMSILGAEQNRKLLGRACEAAGIEMGRFDDKVIEWLAGYEDAMCGAIAGMILRAAKQ